MAEQTITLKIPPSACNTEDLNVSNLENAYADTDSNTYALLENTNYGYAEFYGFDFSQIPSGATITNIAFRIKVAGEGGLLLGSYDSELSETYYPTSSATVITITPYNPITLQQLINMGDNFYFILYFDGIGDSMQVYGMQVSVTYTIDTPDIPSTSVILTPTAYSTTNVATVTNPSNAYTDTTSTTYASVTTTSNSASKAYFYGFDFSQIPSNAENVSFTCKIKVSLGVGSTGSAYNVCLANRSNGDALSATTATTTTATVVTLTPTSATWSDIVALGNNFAFCINHQRTNRTHYVYGMEIDVTYEIPPDPVPNKVTYNGNTLIDLTGDDVTVSDVLSGVLFHLPNGEQATGTLAFASGLEYESGTWSPTTNTTRGTIYYSKVYDAPPSIVAIWRTNAGNTVSNALTFMAIDYTTLGSSLSIPYYKSFYFRTYYTSSAEHYYNFNEISFGGADTGNSNSLFWRYYADVDAFHPTIAGANWQSQGVYDWIAIWAPTT